MSDADVKADLHAYLRDSRETLVWKLDGLREYDVRRPMTPTGTNLLGLVKHSGATHLRYFGEVLGRPIPADLQWLVQGHGPNAELWATADEPRSTVIAAARDAWSFADSTIADIPLDERVQVPWWGPEPVSLHRVLVHVTAETQRHAGHADILRERLDGSAGLLAGFDNLRITDPAEQDRFLQMLEDTARRATEE